MTFAVDAKNAGIRKERGGIGRITGRKKGAGIPIFLRNIQIFNERIYLLSIISFCGGFLKFNL